MKRFHIHLGVEALDESIRFYSALFGAEPVKRKPDYAQWLLDDPRVNFAISTRVKKNGMDHLGIQVEEEGELTQLRERLKAADMAVVDEGETVCCYAHSDKSWIQDPAGIPWEAYRTMAITGQFDDQTVTLLPVHDIDLCQKCGQRLSLFDDHFPILSGGGLFKCRTDLADFLKAVAATVTFHSMTKQTYSLLVAGFCGAHQRRCVLPSVLQEAGDEFF